MRKKSRKGFKATALLLAVLVSCTILLPMGAFATTDEVAAGDAPADTATVQQDPELDTSLPDVTLTGAGLEGEDGLTGQGNPVLTPPAIRHDVFFYGAEERLEDQRKVDAGAIAAAPEHDPAAPEGSRFVGWFEKDATEAFKFESTPVNAELKLYARFEAVSTGGDSTPEDDGTQPPPAHDDKTEAPETEEVTVTFVVDGRPHSAATVEKNTLVRLPTPTSAESSDPFLGWYAEGESTPFSARRVVTGDITLTARFSQNLLVTYLNTDGTELEVIEFENGAGAPLPTKAPALAMGEALLHWAAKGATAAYDYPAVTESVTLVPILEDTALAVFITAGSEVEPQTAAGSFYAAEPETIPTRDGYTFAGWSPREDGAGDFDFAGTLIEGTRFIYARWEAAEANYTVNVWVEKADATATGNPVTGGRSAYELQHTATAAGITGEDVKLTDEEARATLGGAVASVKNLLMYSTFKASEEKTVSANGDTVVNVFYTRTAFTFHFDVSKYNGSIFLLDGADKGDTYTIKVKVEQDITDIWPSRVEFDSARTTAKFANWSDYYGNNGTRVSYSYISVAFSNPMLTATPASVSPYWYDITDVKRNEVTLYPALVVNPYTETRYYYTELSAAEAAEYEETGHVSGVKDADIRTWACGNATYGGARTYKLAATGGTNNQSTNPGVAGATAGVPVTGATAGARTWPGRDIEGFETIASKSEKNAVCTTLDFQEIVLESGKHYILNYFMPRKDNTLTLVTGNGAIVDPAEGLRAGSGQYTATVRYDEPVASLLPTEVKLNNYAFEGWYTDEARTEKYTPGNMPGSNLTLYAKYRGTAVSVTYTNGVESYETTYALNEKLLAHDLAGTGFEGYQEGEAVPGMGIFKGWFYEVGATNKATVAFPLGLSLERTGYTLTARFDPTTYDVTFVGDEGGARLTQYDVERVHSGAGNTLALSGHYSLVPPAREGYTFKGWSTKAGGTAPNFTTATRVLDDITVYAIWEAIPVTLSFNANGGATTPEPLEYTLDYGQSLLGAGKTVPGSEAVARDGHTLAGWFTQAAGGSAFDFETALKEERTVVYAHWDATATTPGTDPDPDPTVPPVVDVTPETEPDPGVIFENDPVAQAQIDEQTGNPVTDILHENVPMGNLGIGGAWSLLSLLMAVAGVVVSIPLALTMIRRKKNEDEDGEDGQAQTKTRSRLLKLLGVIAGLLTAILFLILENLALPMVFINRWTLWIAIPFVAQMVLLVTQLIVRRKHDGGEVPAKAAID